MEKEMKRLNRQLFWSVGVGAIIKFVAVWVVVGMVIVIECDVMEASDVISFMLTIQFFIPVYDVDIRIDLSLHAICGEGSPNSNHCAIRHVFPTPGKIKYHLVDLLSTQL